VDRCAVVRHDGDRSAFAAQKHIVRPSGYFKDPRPTRTTVVVPRLVGEGHIEITVTARQSAPMTH
jgi:hypothetical protein